MVRAETHYIRTNPFTTTIFVSPSNHVKVEKSEAALQVRLKENVVFPQDEPDMNKRLNLSAEEGETYSLPTPRFSSLL